MFFPLVVLVSLAGLCSCAPTEQTCPGGYREGEKVEKGSVWFECRSGQLQAKGCLTPNGERLKAGDIHDLNSVRSVCQLDGGNPNLVPKSCVQNNQEHQVGDRWDDTRYVFTCKKEGGVISPQISGCIREGKKLDVGERMVLRDVVYECKQGDQTPFLAPWGCVAEDGSQHAAGGSFETGPYWYTCENKNGIINLELSGCVNQGTRFSNGDRFFKDDVVFECQAKENGANMKVVGCMQENGKTGVKIERRVGCTWTEGDLPYQVTMTCKPDQEAKTAVATVVNCNYKMPQGTIYNINIGCYRIFEDVAVGCLKNSNTGKVTAEPLQVSTKGDVQSVPQGLKFC